MKDLKFLGMCLLCLCMSAGISAQTKIPPVNEPDLNKPRLFDELPEHLPVSINQIESLLNGDAVAGKQVNLEFSDKKLPVLAGKIISVDSKYGNTIRTLIIRSSNFSGATLTLSSSTHSDGTVNYTGRIISLKHGDLYLLEKQNEQYVLVKKKFHELINE